MKTLTLLFFCAFGFAKSAFKQKVPGCQFFNCNKNVSFGAAVSSCDDCYNNTLPLKRFCTAVNNVSYCVNEIPQTCIVSSSTALTKFCLLQQKYVLPVPIINQTNTIDVLIPRFFELDKFEHLHFRNLSFQIYFEKQENSSCQSHTFTERKTSNKSNCLWSLPVLLPTIDAKDALSDVYYYDDQSDLSLSFPLKLIPRKSNGLISVWYRVTADYPFEHNKQNLTFSMSLYSYRKDV